MSKATTNVHKDFDTPGADVTICSSDNILFNLHRANLAVGTGAFPGMEMSTNGEQVQLSEPSDVLEILFQFIYPKRHPTLKGLDFDMVLRVAEAAEKYEVFPALHTCEMRLRENMQEHALKILVHANKHDYQDLMNESSQILILKPIVPILEKLPGELVIPWVKYRESWKKLFDNAMDLVVINPAQYSYCVAENGDLGDNFAHMLFCPPCSHAMKAWISDLSRIDEVDLLRSTIMAYTGDLQLQDCGDIQCSHGNVRCRHISFMRGFLVGCLDVIKPFTSFLRATPTAS